MNSLSANALLEYATCGCRVEFDQKYAHCHSPGRPQKRRYSGARDPTLLTLYASPKDGNQFKGTSDGSPTRESSI